MKRETVAHQPEAPILEVINLSLTYGANSALHDVSFSLEAGERIAVVGPNGAGKSTLFKVIAGVLEPSAGKVRVAGTKPGGHICIAYVPQRSNVDWSFPVTVSDVVMMGRTGQVGLFRSPGGKDWQRVRSCLEVVGMTELASCPIDELSGGQQQRMFIARSLAQEAQLILMDEPLTGLDMPSVDGIFRILGELRQQRVTILLATHDLTLAAEHFDRVMLLNKRLFGIGSSAEVFTSDRLHEAYGSHLHLLSSDGRTAAVADTCCDARQ